MNKISFPLIIAHRGASGVRPENSLVAVEHAFKFSDIAEIDLQLTKDKEVVCFHDETLERIVKNQFGKRVQDFTYDELVKFDVGSWFDSKYSNTKIPRLKDVLTLPIKNKDFIFEIKCKTSIEEKKELVREVLRLLDHFSVKFNHGYLSVRDIETYKIIKDYSSDYPIGLMQKKRTPKETVKLIKEQTIPIIQIRWKEWSKKEWDLLKQIDPVITAFYADKTEDFEFLIAKQVHGIFTNYPEKLKKYYGKRET